MEGAATTVYAQGGRGNSRLIAWEGERTVTYTMEDALISPEGFMILSGAGLVVASEGDDGVAQTIYTHTTERLAFDKAGKKEGTNVTLTLTEEPHTATGENFIYVMVLDEEGDIVTEPYCVGITASGNTITISGEVNDITKFTAGCTVLVDYYVARTSGARQIDITPDKFGGNYYLEASTLFRTTDGVDLPAEFIIPNCKIQSNFTFTMASSGDPSTFTFTMDAFPDYTRFDTTKKVLAAIQILDPVAATSLGDARTATAHNYVKNASVED